MTTPSSIAALISLAEKAGLAASIDEPMLQDGFWWIDLRRGEVQEEIEWHH